MKGYGEVVVQIHIFLISTLAGGEWSASRPCRFTYREIAPGTHWIGGLADPRAGLDDVEKRKFLTLPCTKGDLYPVWVNCSGNSRKECSDKSYEK
jgi:hypothetical protein